MNCAILIVEDEGKLREVLCDYFRSKGEIPSQAADGLQAVGAMREQPFPIVVMDVKMPNMDGIAALKIIVEQWPTAQVILLSGHADMQLAVQAMSEGAFGYLMKPVDFDELLFKIEDAAMQSRLEGPESDMAR